MIVVCREFEERLDKAWRLLQRAIQEQADRSISQYALDDITVRIIEHTALAVKAGAVTAEGEQAV